MIIGSQLTGEEIGKVVGSGLTVVGGAISAYSLYGDRDRGDVARPELAIWLVSYRLSTLTGAAFGSTALASIVAVNGAFAIGYGGGSWFGRVG